MTYFDSFAFKQRNYHLFFMFVFSTTILCLYVFAFCWVNLKKIMEAYECSLWAAVLKSPVSGILVIYTFIATWFVGGLTAFHVYLICTNQVSFLLLKTWIASQFCMFPCANITALSPLCRPHMRIFGIAMMAK